VPEVSVPEVSVIVAVYNPGPYLNRCVDSVLGQTIGRDRLELIAVDDASTDGSRAVLDRYAARYPGVVRVIHRSTNSGGPAEPSNQGIDAATGRYLFFLGSDDYLGPQALQRLVSAADRLGADVAAGRMVGVNGRWVPTDIFAASADAVDLFSSSLPFALSNTKLFRRSLIEAHGIRYPQDLPVGSDQPFTLSALLHAQRISVLADYDYYFAVRREDASNITYRRRPEILVRCTAAIMAYTASVLEPGPRRDAINYRHFASELAKLLRPEFLALDEAEQRPVLAGIGALVKEHMTVEVQARLDPSRRLRLELAARNDLATLAGVIRQDAGPHRPTVRVEGGTAYLAYDCFRAPGLDLPDGLFALTSDPDQVAAALWRVSAVAWSGDGLTVSATSPAPPADPPVTVGAAAARTVASITAAGSGSTLRVTLPLRELVGSARPLGQRLDITLATAGGLVVPLRMVSNALPGKRLARRGQRVYLVRPVVGTDGQLAVDIRPVTVGKVISKAHQAWRRTVKRGSN
jgi:glycosyltransferase involved in cell wall biosynthesis